MRVYLLRHAEHPKDVIAGLADVPLTERGKRQADEIVTYFVQQKQKMGITKLVSSDLRRTYDTILPLSKALHLPIVQDEAWNPLDWGELNGCDYEKSKIIYPYLRPEYMDWDEEFPKGESLKTFYDRTVQAWKDLLKKYAPNDNVLVCTHGLNMVVLDHYLHHKTWNYQDRKNYLPCVLMTVDVLFRRIYTQALVQTRQKES
jgi:probable phosphoglycerate mutase